MLYYSILEKYHFLETKMTEEAAKLEFHKLINAQNILDQELSRRLNIECLAVPACSLCLVYQDMSPHLLDASGERIVEGSTTDSVAQMGFHCGQRGPQKKSARDGLYTERMEKFKVRSKKHEEQTVAAIEILKKAGVDAGLSGPARLQKREAIPTVDLEGGTETVEEGSPEMTKLALAKAKEDLRLSKITVDEQNQQLASLKHSVNNLTSLTTSQDSQNTTKKLLERANANNAKYLQIFTDIYESNARGDMDLTVGMGEGTTTWQVVKLEDEWNYQWESKKKRIVENHLMTSGSNEEVGTSGEGKLATQANLIKVGTSQSEHGEDTKGATGADQNNINVKSSWTNAVNNNSPGNSWAATSSFQPANAGLRQELQQTVQVPPPTSGWWASPGQQQQQQQQGQQPVINNCNTSNYDLRKILSDSGRIIQTKIVNVSDLLELIMDMATLDTSVKTFYGELSEKVKILVYAGKLGGNIKSIADEVIMKMDNEKRYNLGHFQNELLEKLYPNSEMVIENDFRIFKQGTRALFEYSRRHILYLNKLKKSPEKHKLKWIEGITDVALRSALAVSNYTKLSHDELVSYANSIIHSRQKTVHSGGGSHQTSNTNTVAEIGGEVGSYWDISLEQGWSEADMVTLAMSTIGMGEDTIMDEILWAKLGVMGQLLKTLNFDPNRCANCLKLIDHRAYECTEICRFCKEKADHPSLMCKLAPPDVLSWGQVLKTMDEKFPNSFVSTPSYMTKDTKIIRGRGGSTHRGFRGRGRGRGRGGGQGQKGEQRQYFTREDDTGLNKEDLARICSQD
jgi:hypothetical protein